MGVNVLPFKLRMAKAKREISMSVGKPSGKVSYATNGGEKKLQYKFFELKDFLPKTLEILDKYEILSIFTYQEDKKGVTLTFMDAHSEETIEYRMPCVNTTNNFATMNSAIQSLGAQTTFLRRYCYMNALDLAMDDEVEPASAKPKPRETPMSMIPTSVLDALKAKYSPEKLKEICKENGVNKIYDLPIDVATTWATMEKIDG